MATTTTAVFIDQLAQRLRDYPTTAGLRHLAHTRVNILDVLNRVHRAVNAGLGLKLKTVDLVMTVGQTLYPVTAIATDIVRIVSVRDDARKLQEVPWNHIVHQDSEWFRRTGESQEVFARIGRDMFVIYPAPRRALTLTFTYVKLCSALIDGASMAELPEEYMDLVVDLTEAILLLRGRVLTPNALEAVIQRFMAAMPLARMDAKQD